MLAVAIAAITATAPPSIFLEGPQGGALAMMLEEERPGAIATASRAADLRAALEVGMNDLHLVVRDRDGEIRLERNIERADPITASLRVAVLLILRVWESQPLERTQQNAPIAAPPPAPIVPPAPVPWTLSLFGAASWLSGPPPEIGLGAKIRREVGPIELGLALTGVGLGCCEQSTRDMRGTSLEIGLDLELGFRALELKLGTLGLLAGAGATFARVDAEAQGGQPSFDGVKDPHAGVSFLGLLGLTFSAPLGGRWSLEVAAGARLVAPRLGVLFPDQPLFRDAIPLEAMVVSPFFRLGVSSAIL